MIITKFIYPPLTIRNFDWIAYEDGQEEGPFGTGETEQEALESLKEALEP